MDICVVGAGVIGATVAYEAAGRGASVTVVDASAHTRGASYASFAWINANGKTPTHYFELNRDGIDAHADLARRLGDDTWLHRGGSLEWAEEAGSAKLRARVAAHAAQGYPAELLAVDRARELEPNLQLDSAGSEVAYFASEGWVDCVALIGRLLSAARTRGAVVRAGVRVERVDSDGAQLDDGSRVRAEVVVNCAGPDAGFLAAQGGLALDAAGAVGLNAVIAPGDYGIGRVVRTPTAHFRPETGGRVMIAAPSIDTELAVGADPATLAQRLVEMAARYVPALAGAAVAEARVARRAIPGDGLPVVGSVAGAPWLYHVVTHSGVTLAPLLARLVAEEIVDGAEHGRLAPYRPERLLSR